jgi:hypothetical protein
MIANCLKNVNIEKLLKIFWKQKFYSENKTGALPQNAVVRKREGNKIV